MRAAHVICAIVAGLFGLLANSFGQSDGEKFTVRFDRGKPISLTSIGFGDAGVQSFGSGQAGPSDVNFSVSTEFEALPGIVRNCVTGGKFSRVVASHTNQQGVVDYTIEFKHVAIASVTFPAGDSATKQPGDIAWSLAPDEEHFHYELMQGKGSDLSEANQRRLERSHDRMEAMLWQKVQRDGWRAASADMDAPSGQPFALDIPDFNSHGITALGPLLIERNSVPKGKSGEDSFHLALTVESGRAVNFTSALKTGKPIAKGELIYRRMNADGKDIDLRLDLTGVTFARTGPAKDAPEAVPLSIEMNFAGLELTIDTP